MAAAQYRQWVWNRSHGSYGAGEHRGEHGVHQGEGGRQGQEQEVEEVAGVAPHLAVHGHSGELTLKGNASSVLKFVLRNCFKHPSQV